MWNNYVYASFRKTSYFWNTDKDVLKKVERGVFEFHDNDMSEKSEECVVFLNELLRIDPGKRPSANLVFKNKWLNYFSIKQSEKQLQKFFFKNWSR